MDDCAPNGGKREITARRRRRRGERGCTTMISFFHVLLGKFANEFCCCVYQVWIGYFCLANLFFACALLQRCCLSWSFVPRMGFGNAYVPSSSYHHHHLLTSTTSGVSRCGLAIYMKKCLKAKEE